MAALRRIALCTLALVAAASDSRAQNYPTRPVRLIVPFASGGSVDVLGRMVGQKLAEAWGQQVVVDNRPGAGGNVGAELAANALPDGHTLFLCTQSFVVNPGLYRNIAYDPFRDFAPVTLLAATQNVLLAHPTLPVKNVRELIAFARTTPGAINYASTGNGSSGHLTMELFRSMARIDHIHVPYKVIGQALADLMSGQVSVWFPSLPGALPHIRGGRIVALAVGGNKRSPALPEVPTVAASGLPGFEASTWYAMLVPAGTPAPVVSQIRNQLVAIVNATDMQERFAAQGLEPIASTPAQFASHLRSESAKWAQVVKASGARVD